MVGVDRHYNTVQYNTLQSLTGVVQRSLQLMDERVALSRTLAELDPRAAHQGDLLEALLGLGELLDQFQTLQLQHLLVVQTLQRVD